MSLARERVVVVGNGMASLRFLERLTEGAPGRFDVSVIGAEPNAAYNRVLLSSLLGGEVDEAACAFRDRDWYAGHGIALHTGIPATAIDRAARTVTVGECALPYDRLVLATGSLPIRLPKPGMDLPGVVAFRDLADVATIRRVAVPGARAIVIGGGLLGLEAAVSLARLGVATTLLHVMDRLMERQLDAAAARLVRGAIETRGVTVELAADTAAIEGEGRVEAVRLADGRAIPADIVVLSVGVRPNVALAAAAGLDIGRGIRVDDAMRTSDNRVFALGECAEHRGLCYGLVEPVYEQADTLAGILIEDAGTYAGTALATSLKVSGLPVFSAGEVVEAEGDEVVVWSDPGLALYRKLVLRAGALVGAVFVGDVAEQAATRARIRAGARLAPGEAEDLMFGPAALAA